MQPDEPGKPRVGEAPQYGGGLIKTHDKQQVPAANVPVFNCLVYVSQQDGGVKARVANLAGIEYIAGNERAALGQIVPAFKQRLVEYLQGDEPIPWLEPPLPIEPGEQKRFVPVHL